MWTIRLHVVWECDKFLIMTMCAEFVADDRSVDVNEGDTQSMLTLTVERVGGAVGVVQVLWTLTRSDGTCMFYVKELLNSEFLLLTHPHPYIHTHTHTHTHTVGGDPSADILPVSGSLQFITNARRQTISLTILPDDLPEVDEVCMCSV